MREIEKWMDIAANNPVAQNYIPMGYQPTMPLLCRKGERWAIVVFYYHMTMACARIVIETPAFVTEFDPVTGKVLKFEKLSKGGEVLAGYSGLIEYIPKENKERQKEYMQEFDDLMELWNLSGLEGGPEEPDEAELRETFEKWLEAHPKMLQKSLSETFSVMQGSTI